jgi:cardiolipin synthase A/B
MRYRFYTTSEKTWVAMLDSIRRADSSIYWEIHDLRDDTPQHKFFEALKEKARAGVRVKIIIDAFGSFGLKNSARRSLENAGVEVLSFSSLLHRIHKKILIIDEGIAFLGGVNVGYRYRAWLDLHMRLQGRVVKKLIRSFSRSYKLCGGRDSHVLKLYRQTKSQKAKKRLDIAKHWFIDHAPILKKNQALKNYYKKRITKARKRIVIVTPYFIPHKWLVGLLKDASQREVVVDVIIPERTDVGIARLANYVFAHQLQKRGVNFYLSREMIHAKVFLVDDEEGMIGSNNIDAQSFDFNSETSLVFRRKDMVGNLKRIIEGWKNGAVPFQQSPGYKSHWYEKPAQWFIQLFRPIL